MQTTQALTKQNKEKEIKARKKNHWLRKGNLKKETEDLGMATQNNAIRTMS